MTHVATPETTLFSVCSGTGMLDVGLQLALEWHGCRTRVVGYCERESSAAAILMARMEEQSLEPSPVWAGNLEDLRTEPLRGLVDGVVGGIPCQPFSSAGQRLGLDDPRWLWPKFRDFTISVGAKFIALENVSGFDKKGLRPVLDDLAALGWAAEWCHLRASEVGANHRRERLFLMAHAQDFRPQASCMPIQPAPQHAELGGCERVVVNAEGRENRFGENGILGEAKATGERRVDAAGNAGRINDANSQPNRLDWCLPYFFAPDRNPDNWRGILEANPHLAPALESGFCVLVDGVAVALDADRADQLRASGNSVVALQAAVAYGHLFDRLFNFKHLT